MSYMRVLPRDAFNEANFLKCIAKLTMALEDGLFPFISYEFDGEAFDLDQDCDGCLYITNMQFYYKGEQLIISRPLNSREEWPLYINAPEDCISIFDPEGNVILNEDILTRYL